MYRSQILLLIAFAAGPALAQEDAAQAVGAGVGLLIGLAIMIVVGAVVGWLASLIVKGSGSGFWWDVLIGIGGSILAGYLLPAIGVNFGSGVIGALVPAVIGAIILLLIVRLIRRGAG
jgi:uncharacterized membrane protein YeaQ/YmgE (transglycosylase-associated protein family)